MFKSLSKYTLAAVFLSCAGVAQVSAQQWPSKTVTIVVPFAAGGSTDIVARLMAERLRSVFGGAFVIENKPGATGNLGVSFAAEGAARRLHAAVLDLRASRNQCPDIQESARRSVEGTDADRAGRGSAAARGGQCETAHS